MYHNLLYYWAKSQDRTWEDSTALNRSRRTARNRVFVVRNSRSKARNREVAVTRNRVGVAGIGPG